MADNGINNVCRTNIKYTHALSLRICDDTDTNPARFNGRLHVFCLSLQNFVRFFCVASVKSAKKKEEKIYTKISGEKAPFVRPFA